MPKALLRGFSFIAGVILFMPTFILHEYTSFAYVLQTALVVGAIVLINSPRYSISIFGWWSLWECLQLYLSPCLFCMPYYHQVIADPVKTYLTKF